MSPRAFRLAFIELGAGVPSGKSAGTESDADANREDGAQSRRVRFKQLVNIISMIPLFLILNEHLLNKK